MARRESHITAGPGGVMTDDVGVITGDLTLRTDLADDGSVVLWASYQDAAEWYVVTGSRARLVDERDIDALHSQAVGLLHRPTDGGPTSAAGSSPVAAPG